MHCFCTIQSRQQVLAMFLRIYVAVFLASISGTRSSSLLFAAPASDARLSRIPDRPEPGSRPASYTQQGIVVNSVTNEPVPRALVTLSFEGVRLAFAEADGTFQFEGLLYSGQGAIDAKKPGYFSPQDVRTRYRSACSLKVWRLSTLAADTNTDQRGDGDQRVAQA